jgi:hypothetical protein
MNVTKPFTSITKPVPHVLQTANIALKGLQDAVNVIKASIGKKKHYYVKTALITVPSANPSQVAKNVTQDIS